MTVRKNRSPLLAERDKIEKCKVCGQLKKKYCVRYRPDKDIYDYHDEDGRAWHGKMCGTCHGDSMRARMRRLRKPELSAEIPEEVLNNLVKKEDESV